MITAFVIGFSSLIYFVWLMFLSWLVSRFIRDGKPAMRAALCVIISVMIAWGLSLGLEAWMLRGAAVTRTFQMNDLIVQVAVPLAVFLWEWRSFKRHWIDDEDIAEIFD